MVILHFGVFLFNPGKFVPFLHGELIILLELLLLTFLLLALTTRLRRRFSARTCAELWLLPGVLFFDSVIYRYWRIDDPLLVIRLSRFVLLAAFWIWLAGFLGVLLWKVLSHQHFRKRILENATQAEQWEYGLYARVWQALVPPADVVYRNFIERNICRPVEAILDYRHILRSPTVSSPLTIGLTKKSTFLVLPNQGYSRDELEMILRHEIIHLLREDIRTKFFLAMLCAAGWFIPSLWCGMGFVSEDLELCCDEIVTEGMGPDERKEYAGLLLRAGGTERGFTSCLSASARGFRYRLKRVLHPRCEKTGVSVKILIFTLFVLLWESVGIKEQVGTVQTAILDEGWQICAVQFPSQDGDCTDPAVLEAVEERFRNLTLESELWKDRHSLSDHGISTYNTRELSVILAREDEEQMRVELYPNRIAVYTGKNSKPTVYLTDGAVDLSLLPEPETLRKTLEEGKQ